ncbi:GNAT family N-acetyltransferase [Aliivibrio wodanis]|uniref:GNAT family N-acetyltransferase n=1 Tax=Aliivibrio wodanis TaxID=80852 RepID=UPI00406CB0CA
MESKRIKLEPPSMEGANSMLEAILESERELRDFLPWVDFALTESGSISNTQKAIDSFNSFTDELRYSIVRKSDGYFLGVISLMIRDKSVPAFEIGYWLRTSVTGEGYISEALVLLESYAFNELGANRVAITAASKNKKSCAVAERGGYQFEGKLLNARRLVSGELDSTMVYAKTCL